MDHAPPHCDYLAAKPNGCSSLAPSSLPPTARALQSQGYGDKSVSTFILMSLIVVFEGQKKAFLWPTPGGLDRRSGECLRYRRFSISPHARAPQHVVLRAVPSSYSLSHSPCRNSSAHSVNTSGCLSIGPWLAFGKFVSVLRFSDYDARCRHPCPARPNF